MKYIHVDSAGKCLNNMKLSSSKAFEEILPRYRFYLAFENSECFDYVTEKYWRSLASGAIPVVLGAPNIDNFAPAPNSIIKECPLSIRFRFSRIFSLTCHGFPPPRRRRTFQLRGGWPNDFSRSRQMTQLSTR